MRDPELSLFLYTRSVIVFNSYSKWTIILPDLELIEPQFWLDCSTTPRDTSTSLSIRVQFVIFNSVLASFGDIVLSVQWLWLTWIICWTGRTRAGSSWKFAGSSRGTSAPGRIPSVSSHILQPTSRSRTAASQPATIVLR